MKNWVSAVSDRVQACLGTLQIRKFFALALAGILFLTVNANDENDFYSRNNSQEVTKRVLERVHENDSPRPKTTGEWQREDRATANKPDERGKRIADESGAALKEFGSGYAKAMKDSVKDAKDSVERAGSQIMD